MRQRCTIVPSCACKVKAALLLVVTDVDDAEDFGGPPYACSSSRYRSIFVDSDWKMVSNGRAVLLFICNGVDVGCTGDIEVEGGGDGVVEEVVVVLLTAVNMLSIPSETLFQPNGPLTLRIRRHLGHCGGHGEWFPCDGL